MCTNTARSQRTAASYGIHLRKVSLRIDRGLEELASRKAEGLSALPSLQKSGLRRLGQRPSVVFLAHRRRNAPLSPTTWPETRNVLFEASRPTEQVVVGSARFQELLQQGFYSHEVLTCISAATPCKGIRCAQRARCVDASLHRRGTCAVVGLQLCLAVH